MKLPANLKIKRSIFISISFASMVFPKGNHR
jgi:hypothetical protein